MDNALRIFLGHLSNRSSGVESDSFPLNIGFLAAYLLKNSSSPLEIRLFVDVDKLCDAVQLSPPHVLALSCYIWNNSLTEHVFQWAKQLNPDILTVGGGPMYPRLHLNRQRYWETAKSYLNFYVDGEGEETFCALIEAIQSHRLVKDIIGYGIDGIDFWDHKTQSLVFNSPRRRIRYIEENIPSPILTGVLDEFMSLSPMLQTNRGCPYKCSFCHEAGSYYNRVHNFSYERIVEELEYIRRAGNTHEYISFTDSNFGMFPKDSDLISYVTQSKRDTGWPSHLYVSPAKKLTERFMRAVQSSDGMLRVGFHLQSTNKKTLRVIHRGNRSEKEIRQFFDNFSEEKYKYPSNTSLIIPMPEETFNSYLEGIKKIIDDFKISECNVWTLQIFWGTDFENTEMQNKYGMLIKYRVLEGNYGQFNEFSSIEIDSVCVGTNSFSEEEYLKARSIYFMATIFYFKRNFLYVRRYLTNKNLSVFDWVIHLFKSRQNANHNAKNLFDEFDRMTRDELFETPDAIIEIWKDLHKRERILRGEIGFNVIQVGLGNLADFYEDIVDFAHDATLIFLEKSNVPVNVDELEDIFNATRYSRLAKVSIAELDRGIIEMFRHDVCAWEQEKFAKDISNYRLKEPIPITFIFDDDQKHDLRVAIKSIPAKDFVRRGKFFYRIHPDRYCRQLRYA